MTYRIIQWGTGSVGKHALRAVLERPDFELVGVRVFDPAKVGMDAGALLGADPVGVLATDSVDEILDLDADCVCVAARGSTLETPEETVDAICDLLASGKNVVSCALEYLGFLRPGVELPKAGVNAYERMIAACEKGNASFFHGGINPGFTFEPLPLLISQVSRSINCVTMTELCEMRNNPSPHMVEYMGFGVAPGESEMHQRYSSDVEGSVFNLCMRLLAEHLGIEIEEVRYDRIDAVTPVDFEVASGTIRAGTTGAMKFWLEGLVGGKPAIVYNWVWRVTDAIAPEWPSGDSRWIVDIDGDPSLKADFTINTADGSRPVSLAVATVLLNAVPSVCAAPPGIYNNVTIPLHGGGYLAR